MGRSIKSFQNSLVGSWLKLGKKGFDKTWSSVSNSSMFRPWFQSKTNLHLGAVQVSCDRSRGEGGYPKCSLSLTRGEGGGTVKLSLNHDHSLGERGEEPK